MKKFLSLSLALLMTVGMLAGCGGSGSGSASPAPAAPAASAPAASTPAPAGEAADLTFTTGGSQGTYYGFGSVLAQYVSSNTNVNITAIESGGSKANIEAMAEGEADLGFVQSDVMAYAYDGTRLFEGDAVDDISVAAALYMEQVQIVTTNPDVKTVADLKGKNVSIGAAGSGVYFNAIDVLGAYGLTESDINATYQSFGDSADALQDGKIDAAFVVAGAPTTAITSLATAKDVYLVNLDDEHIDKLIAESPYYTKYVIPAGTYEGLDTDTTTVAVGAVVIVNDEVSEDAVYQTVSTIFENVEAITKQHAKGGELDLEFASSMTSIPYHPGAAKYFAEKGITVPTK
ncbi:TAXI family TRAP transporter solute-binding subunit [Dysosmobacter sp.]|uniref:TAXI family TRAP transporter solute-binding subunit n=1 Tax=Dysosmobacter sp. TaxID=2591382 RepID=UPI002A864709|nr:TAXI family TRAP transporter solute-binding subunit [Dysosmobacter sp.]MDY3281043.1 TAXI family TRAP transporter solute-binding subunit [Dysosmobacter sp.]